MDKPLIILQFADKVRDSDIEAMRVYAERALEGCARVMLLDSRVELTVVGQNETKATH